MKKWMTVLLILILGTILCSCNLGSTDIINNGGEGEIPSPESVYSGEYKNVMINPENRYDYNQLLTDGDNLYMVTESVIMESGQAHTQVEKYEQNSGEMTDSYDVGELMVSEGIIGGNYTSCAVSAIGKAENGSILLLVRIVEADSHDRNEAYLIELDAFGTIKNEKALCEEITDTFVSGVKVNVGEYDGSRYVCSDKIYEINLQGDIENSIGVPNSSSIVFFTTQGIYSLIDDSGKYVVKTLIGNEVFFETSERIVAIGDGRSKNEILIETIDSVFAYDVSVKSFTCLFSQDRISPIDTEHIVVMGKQNGEIVLISGSYEFERAEIVRAYAVAQNDSRKPVELILHCNDIKGTDLEYAVRDFNRTQSEYVIKIENHAEEEAYELSTKLISSNEKADLICLDLFFDTEVLKSGVLYDDLLTYMESSDLVNVGDYPQSLLSGYVFAGKQVAIPYSYSLVAYVGNKNIVGEKEGTTLDECIEVIQTHPEAAIQPWNNVVSLRFLLNASSEKFYDPNNSVCNFDSPEFAKILELLERKTNNVEDTACAIWNGELLFEQVAIGSLCDLQNAFADERNCVVLKGYPSINGNLMCEYALDTKNVGIFSESKNKEGAWKFIEFYLSRPYSANILKYQIPSKTSEIEKMLEVQETELRRLAAFSMYTDTANSEYLNHTHIPTKEEKEQLIRVIESGFIPTLPEQIFEIIIEEAVPYWEGQKSLENVTSVIQNRARIYMEEHK